ncbi:MAG: 6-carboxytetrahydropterin synthase [Aphanocapsa sp. GSE-SYN-MK-11-07L]|jgi:6-pyruvoyltetrahydropterin/6-carboxytetrahydropterin synthase|nr:6-carboxytetrahydropterin synthase [Aphanocapsa sp. GSE-SYN-MK-11-07L]
MYRLEIQHNAEASHRFWLANCGSKCRNIHGHSWTIVLTLKAEKLDSQGMVIEFGELKAVWRGWLDQHIDHALILNQADPLVQTLRSADPTLRLFLTPEDPTTENLARLLAGQAQAVLDSLGYSPIVQIERLRLEETRVNSAEFLPL